jgi:hypothetical protein
MTTSAHSIRSAVLTLAAAVIFAATAPVALAQSQAKQSKASQSQSNTQAHQPSGQSHDVYAPESSAAHNWTTDQIITATVHQAWVLSGKDEANFFEIVKELAVISAQNRNLTLPDDPAAGRRAGAYIKTQAKADHDQLLYAIVDKSVRMTGKPAPAVASAAKH